MRLNQWLLERYKAGETAVLIIDEAQNLSATVLEEIRLLTNLETATEKLIQIVLAGQPELEYKLSRPELRQLRQRVTLHSKTLPLTLDETSGYIHERLRIAGASDGNIFSPGAIQAVFHYARGIPRVINLLCEHALISGFVEQQKPILPDTIETVAREFQLDQTEPNGREATASAGVAPEVHSLLQNLSNLLERIEQAGNTVESSRQRKS
jgi:type II secretory pathway predicted ATPase ExeA